MSHHHMMMPTIYTPQVKPKKIEPRKSRVQMRGAGGIFQADDTGEVFEAGGLELPQSSLPDQFAPVEGSEQKPHQPQGRLSETTLKMMLEVQELSQIKLA